jgi:hypothetical protein
MAKGSTAMATTTPKYMAVQGAALIVGAVFLVIGVAGFIPGLTEHYQQLDWAGHDSEAKLFGTFTVSGLRNLVHLAFGLAGVVLARTYAASRAYLLFGGAAFLALWLYGLLADHGSDGAAAPLTSADNWLHLALGGVMILLGLTLGGRRDPTRPRARKRSRA